MNDSGGVPVPPGVTTGSLGTEVAAWQSRRVSSALEALLRRHVEAGTIPGAVAALGSGSRAEVVAVGAASVAGTAMPENAIVRIQSMTKPVTSVAALRLVEAGRLDLDQSLEQWLPELADRRVLPHPTAALDDTVPACRPVTLRHLLTNSSGYGMVLVSSPLHEAMLHNGTAAGADPPTVGAEEWLSRLTELPLAFQPGEGWRYHHSFSLLGILVARLTGRTLDDHLAEDLFGPLGMVDTSLWVPEEKLDRLPAAYRHEEPGLVETEPAGGGFYAGPPPFDVDHGELVSTIQDFLRFAGMLACDGLADDGRRIISEEHVRQMTSDQAPPEWKTEDSFFPGFWTTTGWGLGVGVQTNGPHRGRYGWSGGQGTTFFVDPDGTLGVLVTQVELGPEVSLLFEEFHELGRSPA